MNEEQCNYILPIRINGWEWHIRFVSREVMKHELGFDALGFTFIDKFTIDIADTLSKQEAMLRLTHELSHALICTQGRAFQNKFDQEDVCNFVAWELPTINEILKFVDKWWDNYRKKKSEDDEL